MEGHFAPAEDRADGCYIVGAKRRILHYRRHWLRERGPVHIEAVRIEWVPDDLLRHPDEKRIINIKGFV